MVRLLTFFLFHLQELQRTREQGAAMEALLKRECERERREGESVRARLTQLEGKQKDKKRKQTKMVSPPSLTLS